VKFSLRWHSPEDALESFVWNDCVSFRRAIPFGYQGLWQAEQGGENNNDSFHDENTRHFNTSSHSDHQFIDIFTWKRELFSVLSHNRRLEENSKDLSKAFVFLNYLSLIVKRRLLEVFLHKFFE
jgi:hypothetical protein